MPRNVNFINNFDKRLFIILTNHAEDIISMSRFKEVTSYLDDILELVNNQYDISHETQKLLQDIIQIIEFPPILKNEKKINNENNNKVLTELKKLLDEFTPNISKDNFQTKWTEIKSARKNFMQNIAEPLKSKAEEILRSKVSEGTLKYKT